ncbi:MAG: hypothetical protein WBF93_16785 [Pirellulales bacterium]
MTHSYSTRQLEAYLDEALSVPEMADIEAGLRKNHELVDQLAQINSRRDTGIHSLGEVWRRNRLTCPSREELGNYLLKVLPDERADYITFHLSEVQCRQCSANLTDLQNLHGEVDEHVESRRRKYFQSSAGYLKRD